MTGFTGVALGLYLAQLELGALDAGFVIGAGLAGLAGGTALVALRGHRLNSRTMLIGVTVLSAGGMLGLALTERPGWLAAVACLGLVNGMGRDRGPGQTLEQSFLADRVADHRRTRLFARYSMVQDLAGALGSAAAALPVLMQRAWDLPPLAAQRLAFGGAALVAAGPAVCYLALTPETRAGTPAPVGGASPETRRRVTSLSALFALDSVGGGFLAGSILSYWFFERFGLSGAVLGPLFLAGRALNAVSYVAAERLARRIGLIATMVYTHLPSSLLLLALPFAPSAGIAAAVFLAREALVQMDVPTRQSYVAAITRPGERAFALGVTGLVRNVGWATGPAGAGWAMQTWGLGAPLIIGAVLKSAYDVMLYLGFKTLKPPEETA